MSIPGGIRVKLALALLTIVGGALLTAYAIVVPSLERRLVAAKPFPAASPRSSCSASAPTGPCCRRRRHQ